LSKLTPQKCIIALCVVAIILILVLPYLKVEYLTSKYGEQFKELYRMTNMIDGVNVVKVYEYNETEAKIYYIESRRQTGSFVYFCRSDATDDWSMKKWETVWSKHGSADGFVWPYY